MWFWKKIFPEKNIHTALNKFDFDIKPESNMHKSLEIS